MVSAIVEYLFLLIIFDLSRKLEFESEAPGRIRSLHDHLARIPDGSRLRHWRRPIIDSEIC